MEKNIIEFDQVVAAGCGLDVHKSTVVATVGGHGLEEETRTFKTFTSSLLQLRDWLKQQGITHVPMESTSVYWRMILRLCWLMQSMSRMFRDVKPIKPTVAG
jgi:transposase